MLVNRQREKLIQAILFFAKNTKQCGKTKLFKLLYFLDFEHYKLTGRSVTGLDYQAWKFGPVPPQLDEEITNPDPDMSAYVEFVPSKTKKNFNFLVIKPKITPNLQYFSKREINLMRQLATEYKDVNAEEMVEATHLKNSPWHKVFVEEGRQYQKIPYEYVLDEAQDAVKELVKENKEIKENFK